MSLLAKEKYQIISRKYRPQLFTELAGHEAIVTTLKNALRSGRIAQAYLFCGARGTGKTTLARLLAKALNCEQLTSNYEPCNQCPSCQQILKGSSLDVMEIDGASNRGIDDVRQINETIHYAPSSRYKIYIIDEVHMLTKEAFNALLKTLEEPPSYVKFFFATTEPHKVLPTILSRCQRFDLPRLPAETIAHKLQSITQKMGLSVEDAALFLVAKKADGSMRDAESLLDQLICYAPESLSLADVHSLLGLLPSDLFLDLDRAIHKGDRSFAFTLADRIFNQGVDLNYFIEDLLEHFRLLFLLKISPTPALLVKNEEERKAYLDVVSSYKEEECVSLLETTMHYAQQILKTPFKRVGLEMLLLRLLSIHERISVEALIERLISLEKEVSVRDKEVKESTPTSMHEVIEKTPLMPVKESSPRENPEPTALSAPQEASFPNCSAETPLKMTEALIDPLADLPATFEHTSDLAEKSLLSELPEENKESAPQNPQEQSRLWPACAQETPSTQGFFPNAPLPKISSTDKEALPASLFDIPSLPAKTPELTPSVKEEGSQAKQAMPLESSDPVESQVSQKSKQSAYDTLMRFAAVELEGSLSYPPKKI